MKKSIILVCYFFLFFAISGFSKNSSNENIGVSNISDIFQNSSAHTVDCENGPLDTSICYYGNNVTEVTFTSSVPSETLNLIIHSGLVHLNFDELTILDTNGAELYSGYGHFGNLAGLNFQSAGNSITLKIDATNGGAFSCAQGHYDPIEVSVACATCVPPEFHVIKECDADQGMFMADLVVTNLGSAETIEITDNQGNPSAQMSDTGSLSFGPYPYGTDVEFTVTNTDDPNCIVRRVVNSDECPHLPCETAIPFCSIDGLFFENSIDQAYAPAGFDYGCLNGSPGPPRPDWLFVKIDEPGDLTLEIMQNSEFDDEGNPIGNILDVDFIAWGPFDSLADACSNLTVENQVLENSMGDGCSWSGSEIENFGIENAQTGEIYMILVSNWSAGSGYIQISQIDGGGSTDCSIIEQNQYMGCEGDSVLLETEYPDHIAYIWRKYNEETEEYNIIEEEASGSISTTENGIYKLESYNNLGESFLEVFNVTISPLPQLDNLDDNLSFCGSESLTLDGTVTNLSLYGTIDYQWFDENGEISGATDSTIEVSEPGTYTIVVSATILDFNGQESDQTCETSQDVVVSNSEFEVNLGEDQTVCDQDSYDLSVGVIDGNLDDAFFEWTGPSGPISEDQQTITVSETGEYSVEVTINGCTAESTVYIVFDITPEVDLGESMAICDEESITLNATPINLDDIGAVEYLWYYNDNEIIGETSSTLEVDLPGFYKVEVSTLGGCTATETIEVIETLFTLDLGEDQVFCDQDSYDLTVEVINGSSADAFFEWTGPSGPISDDQQTITVSETGEYSVEVTINGCTAESTVYIVFDITPEVDLGESMSICDEESITLDATPINLDDIGTVEYIWYYNDNEIAGETSSTLEVELPGFYKVEVSTLGGCTATEIIEVIETLFTLDLGEDQVFCDQDSYDLTVDVINGSSDDAFFEWTGPSGSISEGQQTITVSETGEYSVEVTINGCTAQSYVYLEFNESPNVDLGEDIYTCFLEGMIINATPSNTDNENTTYEWDYNGSPIDENGPIVSVSLYGYGIYKVNIYENDPDCNTINTITIKEREDFDLYIIANKELETYIKYCENDIDIANYEITFTAILENAVEEDIEFAWYRNGDLIIGASEDAYTINYDHEGEYNDDFVVEVKIGDCVIVSQSLSTNIDISPYEHPCKISEGISPGNNDNINDNLDLTFLDDRSGIENFSVFNRYGSKVYEKRNYQDSWRGQDKNGNSLTSGTYYYVIKLKNEDPVFGRSIQGWIYVNQSLN